MVRDGNTLMLKKNKNYLNKVVKCHSICILILILIRFIRKNKNDEKLGGTVQVLG